VDFGADERLDAAVEAEAVSPAAATLRELEPAAPLNPPPGAAVVATEPGRTPARRAQAATLAPLDPAPRGWLVYLTAFVLSALWALAPIAFAMGYRNRMAPLQDDAFALTVFALLAVGPAAFVWAGAYMIRQGQKLAAETRRAQAMAEEMLAPAVAAAARAGDVAQGVREEIARAGAAAEEARETLLALREALALESDQLNTAAAATARTSQELTTALGRERGQMDELARTLDTQATRVTDAVSQQARMVTEAVEVAQAQLKEAEEALAGRASDLAAAATEAGGAARTAGEDLVRHIARLETAGVGVAEQVKAVETGLSEQRTALITLSHALKADHETFSKDAEAHADTLSEFISQARLSAAEMNDRALRGGETLKALMADAALQFRDLAETARAEREEFGQSTLQSLETVSEAAADQRRQLESQTRAAIEALGRAAEETRAAAERHAATAREQVDQLSEAAFAAGQKANQVFEARLEEARALIEQSARMVEDAGSATARKLDEGAQAAKASLAELSAMLEQIEQQAERLPANAKGHAEQVRAAVVHGVEELMSAARRTAAEAQSIDLAFQERVRRNFEMLSEAVRLMGAAAVAAPSPAGAVQIEPPKPAPAAGRAASARGAVAAKLRAPPPDDEDHSLDDLMEPAAGEAPDTDTLELRPRLKLTPTATDEEFSAVFQAAGGAADAAEDADADADAEGEWTWKDLLASIDGADAAGERLQDQLADELKSMGVDALKLLPKARIDEIAAAVQTGDLAGAREVVKRLAPAAVRRIARKLGAEDKLKRQAQTYVRRYQTLVDDAVVRDPEGFLMAGMLAEEAGRLYLLLDAAAG
jgi:hypothetical protein